MRKISTPAEINAQGTKPKLIQEYIGRVNTKSDGLSIALMVSPEGWSEPGQTPEFDEYTLVLSGTLQVRTKHGTFEVKAGEAFAASRGDWVQYSTPHPGGAEYVATCVPAFSPDLAHRDRSQDS